MDNNGIIKRKVGRPDGMTKHKVSLLQEAFKNGANITQALLLAKVDKNTYYRHLKDNVFKDKMDFARKYPNVISKKNIVNKINEGDVDTSKWWLERKESNEFGLKQQKEVTNVNIIGYITKGQDKQLNNPDIIEGETV